MAAKTLEAKLDDVLEDVEIGMKVLRLGIDVNPPLERLEWIQMLLGNAVELQKKIDKRNARKAAV